MVSRATLKDARCIVVKVGTNVVTHEDGNLALGRLFGIVEDLAELRAQGRQVLLVSSGAVGMGMRALGIRERPDSLGLTQACAAVGQGHLMALFNQAFSQLGALCAQVLLTQSDLAFRDRALYVRTTLMRLFELGVIPVLNENDSVSVRELIGAVDGGFGDNDGLSARVAVSLNADLLLLLTDVDGVYDKNPKEHSDAKRFSQIEGNADVLSISTDGKSRGGRGGMSSKVGAARLASEAGTPVVIGPGSEFQVVRRIIAGEDVGTLVIPPSRRSARHRRIAWVEGQRGALVANAGALEAINQRKASLLPIGVVAVEGQFEPGDVVEIRDTEGRVHGRGLVNYSAAECRALAGSHSSEIDRILGWRGYNALITRTNIVMGQV